jgi:hypothetical protein
VAPGLAYLGFLGGTLVVFTSGYRLNLFPGCHRDRRLRLVIVVAAPVEGRWLIAAHQLSVPGGRMLSELRLPHVAGGS